MTHLPIFETLTAVVMAELKQQLDRATIEKMVRELVYSKLGKKLPTMAAAPNPLVVNVSARHCHLTQEAVEALFGPGYTLHVHKDLYQAGQFAAKETVTLIGPRSRIISNLRILGPCRKASQVELSYTDAISLGFDIPARLSGDIKGTPGCMLMGPAGFYEMEEGVIRALRHAHLGEEDAAFYKVKDGDKMCLKIHGECGLTLDNMLVRVTKGFKLEVHVDTDEGNACHLNGKSFCELLKQS